MNKRETLSELGYEELAETISPDLECAIVGIVTDGCNERVAYDSESFPKGAVIDDETEAIVELMPEKKAIKALGHPIIFGSRGENEYKGAIVGIVEGKLMYDYDRIVSCKASEMKRMNRKARIFKKLGLMKLFPKKFDYLKYALETSDFYIDAVDDTDYNVMRSMPYCMEGPKVIMYRDRFEE